MASGADTRVAYVAETTFGTTPADPAFSALRVTSGGLSTTKATEVSEELRADQNVVDELQTGQDVAGSYPFELSYGSFDDWLEAALGGAWATNVLQNGVTPRFFSVEEIIELGATDSYRRFTGCMINTLSLSIAARQRINGSFGLMGKQETLAEAALANATYGNASTEEIMVAGTSVGTVSIGALSNLCVSALSLQINRNLRPRHCIGSIYSQQMNYGVCDVTGTVDVYFDSNAAYQAVLDHGTAAIEATIGHDANKKYTLSIPRARWLDGSVRIGGKNEDIMVQMPFRGTLSTDHSIQITRAVA